MDASLKANLVPGVDAYEHLAMKSTIAASIAVATAAVSIYNLSRVYTAIYLVASHQISSHPRIPNSLLQSAAVSLTNPHNHVPIHDTRFFTVRVSESPGDEEILSRFVKGFFAGHVFGLERSLLQIAQKEITRFESKRPLPFVLAQLSQLEC
jgi:hypothetical protein